MTGDIDRLSEFNRKRRREYKKNLEDEEFLEDVNEVLRDWEQRRYKEVDVIKHPFIFVFGLPRSGTTLMSQILAYSLDIGYVNNFIARFWLAPVTGIRLFRILYGNERSSNFQSDYATTKDLTGIHEFGYFWRHWLNKGKMSDITGLQKQQQIDWQGLKIILANMQEEFGKGLCGKNIFGAYHMKELTKLLSKVLFVYIERDPLDTAVSILEARKKYYDDLNLWWSYAPPEYDRIKDLHYKEQIGGQIYYLKRFYDNESRKIPGNVLRFQYRQICEEPQSVLDQVKAFTKDCWHYNLEQIESFSKGFPYRSYQDRNREKEDFKQIIKAFEKKENEPLFNF